MAVNGRMPETRALPDPWWATPNIHLCTLRDFTDLCADLGLRIEAASALRAHGAAREIDPLHPLETWRAESALFLLSRGRTAVAPSVAQRDLFG